MRISRVVKYIVFSIELLVFFVVQALPGVVPLIFGVTPMLLLGAVITIALLETEIPAMFFGMSAGLLADISFGSYLGLFGMIMAVICCISSVVLKKKSGINVAAAAWTGSLALLLTTALDWIFRYIVPGFSSPHIVLINSFLPRFFYTLLLLPFLYLLNLGIYLGLRPVESDR